MSKEETIELLAIYLTEMGIGTRERELIIERFNAYNKEKQFGKFDMETMLQVYKATLIKELEEEEKIIITHDTPEIEEVKAEAYRDGIRVAIELIKQT